MSPIELHKVGLGSRMKGKKDASVKSVQDNARAASSEPDSSSSQTLHNVPTAPNKVEQMEQAAAKLVNGIASRYASDGTMTFLAFLQKNGGVELIPVPDPGNLLKIGRHFSSLPQDVQDAMSSSIPEQELEASNTLIGLLKTQSKACMNNVEQPKLKDAECCKGSESIE